jgi:hypothetical protein
LHPELDVPPCQAGRVPAQDQARLVECVHDFCAVCTRV